MAWAWHVQVRAARPLEATLWATLGHGSGLYARARACYKEGLAASGRQAEPVSDHAIGDSPTAETDAARVGLSTKVVVEPTPVQRLMSACRLRWARTVKRLS